MKKTVLITGVSGGIGSACAKVFNDAGWYVAGVDLPGKDTTAGVHRFFNGDVADEKVWSDIAMGLGENQGTVDAIVNNAALQVCKPLLNTMPEEWDAIMSANVRSVYLSVKYCHPLMAEHGGAIVNVSSVHAVATSPNIAAYAASKGAVIALTRAMAIELASDKIRVNSVLPGAVDTQMLHEGLRREHGPDATMKATIDALATKTVMGRIGKPREIAQCILFLAEEERSSFITGQCLIADGGATARLSTE
jgi:NAD(P)-dependent dehydrogenase (short-subunit alcohol dehydrogenase family)